MEYRIYHQDSQEGWHRYGDGVPTLVTATLTAAQYAIDYRVPTAVWAWWGFGTLPVWDNERGVDQSALEYAKMREESTSDNQN